MQIGWVDFSAQERARTLTVLNSLSEPGSVDELGIGIVRDAFADLFFPGTSTLLTKARYFFLVPYLSRYIEEGHDSKPQDPKKLRTLYRDLERECASGMLKCSSDTEGIIGRVALSSGKWVTRGPGEIYWASLRNTGFMRRNAPDSFFAQFSYLAEARLNNQHIGYVKNPDEEDDGLSDDLLSRGSMWRIPKECYDEWKSHWIHWKNDASIKLTESEARYLRNQIVQLHPTSLYGLILSDDTLRKIALATLDGTVEGVAQSTGDSALHQFLRNGGLARLNDICPETATACTLADGFSELVLGCRIAYNMQLKGLEDAGAGEWDQYASRAAQVAQRVDVPTIGAALGLNNHAGFMRMGSFLERAREAMLAGDLDALKLEVAKREAAIKGVRKKINPKSSVTYSWRGGHRLPYRFSNAMSIVREIQEAGGCSA